MAEIAVNLVVDKLIPLLRYEVKLLKEVHSEVAYFEHQLCLIRAYLKDADAKAEEEKTNVVKEWVKQVREVAHRIEDVVDKYLLQVAQRRQKRGLAGVIEKIARLLTSIEPRHGISSEIRDINNVIDRLDKRKDTLGFVASGGESSCDGGSKANSSSGGGTGRHDPRRGALLLGDEKFVGRNDSWNRLNRLLVGEDTRRTVIAVVGTGGLGKTIITWKLYEKLYEKQQRDGRFDYGAWVTVSSTFEVKSIFKSMLKGLYIHDDDDLQDISINKMSKESIMTKVREFLQDKNYLIVFDDVWAQDFWGIVETVLPENNNGSRVIITTRDKGVAEFCKCSAPVYIHELQRLDPGDAMDLFLHKAFQFEPKGCTKELLTLSQAIVKKCDGVPLAIVAIASLLSTKNNNFSEWQKVHDNFGSKLATDPHLKSFHRVLSESYHDLPFHLKPCLLYFGVFPENYSVSCARLIRLWIAEGLVHVKENDNRTPEEVGEEYLDELMRRSLVAVSSEYYDGRARTCRVHGLLHDFIKGKSPELDFGQVIKSKNFALNSSTRRLSIQFQATGEEDAFSRVDEDHSRVRFCFVFNFDQKMPRLMVKSFLSTFKLLVGLDFEDSPLDILPEEIGNLLHLKYLNLQNTKIKTLPRFIGKLRNLETLDLKYTQVSELPVEIYKLVKLRHLLAYTINVETDSTLESIQGVLMKKGIGRLKALQKLLRVDMSNNGDIIVKEFKNLKQLRRFGITKLQRHNGKPLCSAIEGMTQLYSLSIVAAKEHEILDLNSMSNPPRQHLQRLHLYGRLETMPCWIPELHVLSRLCLNWSGLQEDPLPALKDLPELLELDLCDAFEGTELCFREGWFKKLKALGIVKMRAMETLRIERGALPVLEKMTIGPCPKMMEVPNDIQNLETLQHLRFYEMPVNPADVKGCDMLKNIPLVIYSKGDKFYALPTDAGIKNDDV